jgi:hypothetical protein
MGLMWLRIGASGRLLLTQKLTFGFHKIWGTYCLSWDVLLSDTKFVQPMHCTLMSLHYNIYGIHI